MIRLVIPLLLLVSSAFAQRSLKNIPDPNPEAQLKTFTTAEGFKIELFASDPMIAKPVQMNWDEEGRLWVVSSRIYPHIIPGQEARDQVIVLEDRDGDGKADTSTVFADGLLVPTAIIPGHGGAYVANSTELLHLKDTNGDGKADVRRVVLSGFGTEDTHHILHTLRWGMDGDLYMNQSIYIHSHLETPHGPRRLMAGGVWRFRPETMELDVFTRGLVNSWGHDFNRWGQSFQTDGAGGDGINYVYPGIVMVTAYQTPRVVRGLNPGQPKQCGLCVVSGEHFPEAWRDRLITCDFRGNRVNSFALDESGSNYISRKQEDLVSSSSVAFRPIDVRMGPDGALYIADWYNPIIQHGEVDFRDERRDHTHGRIWRVSRTDRKILPRPELSGLSIAALLDKVLSPAGWERTQLRRLIKEQGADQVKPALDAWTAKRADDAERLEALWLYQNIREVNPDLLHRLLSSKDHRVRAASVRVLSRWQSSIPQAQDWLSKAIKDDHPQVRLEAINALRVLGGAEAARLVGESIYDEMDDRYDFAVWLTMRSLEKDWVPELAKNISFFNRPEALMFAIRALNKAEAIQPLVSMWKWGGLPVNQQDQVLNLIGNVGDPSALNLVLDKAVGDASIQKSALQALEAAAGRGKKPGKQPERIASMFSSSDGAVAASAFRLAGRWNLPQLRKQVESLALDTQAAMPTRLAALQGLSAFGKSSVPILDQAYAGDTNPGFRRAVITALANPDPKTGVKRLLEWLPTLEEQQAIQVSSVVSAFLGSKQGPPELQRQLKGKQLPSPVAAEMIRVVSRSGRKNLGGLIKQLQDSGDLQPLTRTLTPDEMTTLVGQVERNGNPARGEAIYRRAGLLCVTCHAIGGAGGKIGPDLTSIGASAPIDYQIESLLSPQTKIKEGYHVSMLTQKNGDVVAGMLTSEDAKTVSVRDAAGKITTVQKSNLAKREIVPTSMMPPGLTNSLRKDEFIDLVAFLSRLGKPGAFNISSTPYVRSWQQLTGDRGEIDAVRHKGLAYPASEAPELNWQMYTSAVDGFLPIYPDLTRFHNIGVANYFFVRFKLEVVEAGELALGFNDVKGLELWSGPTLKLKPSAETRIALPRGIHWITLAIDEKERSGIPLRIELLEGQGRAVSRLLAD